MVDRGQLSESQPVSQAGNSGPWITEVSSLFCLCSVSISFCFPLMPYLELIWDSFDFFSQIPCPSVALVRTMNFPGDFMQQSIPLTH